MITDPDNTTISENFRNFENYSPETIYINCGFCGKEVNINDEYCNCYKGKYLDTKNYNIKKNKGNL